jgi:hypothetical protein
LLTLGDCNITLDNVQYSGFSFTGFTPVGGDVFNLARFSNGAGTVSLSFSPDWLTDIPSASFSYTATLLGGLTFNQAQANLTGSTLGGGVIRLPFPLLNCLPRQLLLVEQVPLRTSTLVSQHKVLTRLLISTSQTIPIV